MESEAFRWSTVGTAATTTLAGLKPCTPPITRHSVRRMIWANMGQAALAFVASPAQMATDYLQLTAISRPVIVRIPLSPQKAFTTPVPRDS
jgi:hypothetical protein